MELSLDTWRGSRWSRLRWRTLPREARDTLFLLGVIGWTVLPHLLRVPLWCTLLTGAVLLWRARLAVVGGALPPRWVLMAMLALAAALAWWSYRTLLGKEPGVTMAVVLMALKTLELRARRDAFVVFFLGFFLVLTHFLYSQSLFVAAAMLVSVWGLLTALVLAHMPVGQPSLRQAATLAARTAALGAPIMVLMFTLFPRIGPLWGVPQDGIGKTGLSNSLRLGGLSEVVLDDSVALRLRFEGAPPPPEALYFRGPVLARFDGLEWRALNSSFPPQLRAGANLRVAGPALRYEMTLEPTRLRALPLLEAAAEAPAVEGLGVAMRDDLQWVTEQPVFERLRISASAQPRFQHGPTQPVLGLQDFVDLPPGYNPRTLAWAAEMRRDPLYAQADARVLAMALMQHIRSGGYTYTLAPGSYGRDAIDEFWLDRREGFCEHFAAAFVVIMRALDVPARIVTGFQGAEPVPVDGYMVVRQSSAHAWAEYWVKGTGWVRADPTAAVAPERISRSRVLQPAQGLVAGAIAGVDPALLERLRNGWEAVNNRWNQWVLNYSRGQQRDLLKELGFRSPNWEDLALLLIGALSSLALAGAAWAAWDRWRAEPRQRQMDRARRALQRLGLAAAAHETPRTLAARVRERFGADGEALAAAFEAIEAQRYARAPAGRRAPDPMRRLLAAARELRAQPGR